MRKHQFPYIESLLTLFILFACCSFFILCDDKEENAITAFAWGKHFPEMLPFEVHPERKFTSIEIGNETTIQNIDHSVFLIRQMKLSQDTIKGIRFHFSDNAKYESLIKVLEICYIEEPGFYMWKDSDIWICNTSEADRLEMKKAFDNFWKKKFER